MIAVPSNAGSASKTQSNDEVAMMPPRWMPFIVLLIGIIVVLFIIDRLFDPQQFRIKQIEMHGQLNHVNSVQVKQIVEATLDGNYFSVNLHQIESEIKQIPWVFSVSLRRRWPSTIVVSITEVQPIARWGKDKWLHFTGDLVARQHYHHQTPHGDSGRNRELSLLSAATDEQAKVVWETFRQWSARFASSGISLVALRLDARDLWWLKLSLGALALNGGQSEQIAQTQKVGGKTLEQPRQVTMVVDKQSSFFRIERFIRAFNQELIVQFPQMKTIDLRYPNGFAISWHGTQPIAQNLATLKVDH